MSRNKSNLKHQMMKRLDSLSRIGASKHREQVRNQTQGRGYKSDFIHSIRTMELYKDEASRFCVWLKENGYTYKRLDVIPRSVAGEYIQSRNGLSAWTSHLSLAAINKLTGYNFTTRELGLKVRRVQDIRNNRGFAHSRPHLEKQFAPTLRFIRACGVRRSSVSAVSYRNFIFNKAGEPESVRVVEKGGKVNHYYILPEYRRELSDLLTSYYATHDLTAPLFPNFDPHRHVNTHWYRNQYSCVLYRQLSDEAATGRPYYGGSEYLHYAIDSGKVARNIERYGSSYKEHDTEVLSLLSQSLGHFRLDVCTDHYLRFDC